MAYIWPLTIDFLENMACSNCSKSADGIPRGCQNNGACGIKGCEKLEVYDWLAGMALPDGQKPFNVIEVRFKNDRKHFYRFSEGSEFFVGEVVVTEAAQGNDVGVVSLTGELVKYQMRKKQVKDNHEIRRVIRKASNDDISRWQQARMREKETMMGVRTIALNLGLEMKLSDVEYQGDGLKAIFYYTADDRVDFRELIKQIADRFRIKVEMRQIGMRQEAARLGSIGSCGRELCCSTWLNDFRSVTTGAARVQQLSLNPQKLAGQCGKLKCCLNYELDQYIEASKEFPSTSVRLHTQKGMAVHFKTDIFKRMMWYIYEDYSVANGPVALTLDAVKTLIEINKRGEKPEDLKNFEFREEVVVDETDYENIVGQDSLTRFDKSKRRNKNRGNNKRQGGPQGNNGPKPQNRNNQSKPQNRDDRPIPQVQPGEQRPPRPENKERDKNRDRNRNRNRNRPKPNGGNEPKA